MYDQLKQILLTLYPVPLTPKGTMKILQKISKWRLVNYIAHLLYPELFLERQDLIRAAKEIGSKLKESRESERHWRIRALNAEQCIIDIRNHTKERISEYDREQNTCLGIYW